MPQYAIIKKSTITPRYSFAKFKMKQQELFEEQNSHPATTASIVAFNPTTWEVCNFHMVTDVDLLMQKRDSELIYQLHHLSYS